MQVTWEESKCCHAGLCVNSLPSVFKVENGQFIIDTTQASDSEIENVVKQCPSGALEITDNN